MSFLGELYEVQKSSANFVLAKESALLSSEQGTGKTTCSLACAEKLKDLKKTKKCLIICPSSLTWQWEERIREFTDEDVTLIEPKGRSQRTYETTTYYTITSYALFRNDFDLICDQHWDIVICDEAEEFANNKSKTAKLIKELNLKVKPTYKWALTGTAISNKLEELYSILYWVDRDFLPAWPVFEERHIIRHPVTKGILKYKNLESLSKYLKKKVDRKTHADFKGQIPELVEKTYYLDKTDEIVKAEQDLLEQLDALAETEFIYEKQLHNPKLSSTFHACRQSLLKPKVKDCTRLCLQLCEENKDNRIVVFSFYKEPLTELAFELSLAGIPHMKFTGDETSEQKQEAVKEFKKRPSVLLCSNAGARGLDLPFANYVVHLDIPFSHGILDQRNKRVTRANSKHKTCVVNYLVIKGSIEEYYQKITKQKGKLAEAAYHGTEDKITIKTQSLRQFLK